MLKITHCVTGISAVLIIIGTSTMAQSPAPCTTPVALGALLLGSIPTAGAPYSATVRTTQDRIMPDGSTVHGSVITYQARDSAGRTWQKRSLGCQPGLDGVRRPVMQTLVYDPGTATTISWKEDDPTKMIRVVPTQPVRLPPVKTDKRDVAAGLRAMEQMGWHVKDLGSKEIAGAVANGTRTDQTVAVQPGIDKPIHISREIWTYEALNLQMLSIDDNSMKGRTVTEVIQFKQGDPDPALFVPPAGWNRMDIKSAR